MRCRSLILLTLALLLGLPSGAHAASTPTFVQAASKQITSGTTNALAFPAANTAGNLIVVYVAWSNPGTVSLSDSRGNTYVSAVGPTAWSGGNRAQVFYARNISGQANTVTATFQTSITSFGILYIHEYSGVDPVNPVDVTAAAAGTSGSLNSGTVTTTNPTDLLFGAGVSISVVTAPGSGYTARSTAFANITEDRNVTTTGSYAATATNSSGAWAMQLVAFRAASGGAPSFDFSLSSEGAKTVARGASVTNVITATLVSGTTAPVSYTVSGLPAGATAAFAPASCSPGCATTLTVTTAATTSAGTSTLTVTGTAGTATRTTSFGLTVTTAPDTTPPTVALTAPVPGVTVSGASVAVSATASDNVGVAGVQFLLDGSSLNPEDTASPYSTAWNTTSVSNGPHTLAARARDAAGNLTTSAAVDVVVDNQPPAGSIVINGGAAATNSRNATLTLSAVDNSGTVAQMRFSNTGTSFSTAEAYATTKAWTLTSGAGTKTVYVQFRDPAGNWSASFTDTIVLDTTAPTISAVSASGVTSSAATITWTTSEPATSQVEYGPTTAYGQLTPVDATLTTAHTVVLSGLASQTQYAYRVRSRDAATNERLGTNQTFSTLSGPDTTPPSVPANPAAVATSPTQITVSWGASTDNVGVTRYDVVRNGTPAGSSTTTSFQDTGLARATTYTYTVTARDAAGNTSGASAPKSATTPALLISGVTSSSVITSSATISWTTDVQADTQVEYGPTASYGQLTTLNPAPVTSHSQVLGGLAANTLYHYRVRSRDTNGNLVTSADFTFTTLSGGAAGFRNEIVVTGLDLPTCIKFLPDGRLLIGGLGGTIWVLQPGATQVDPVPFLRITNIGTGQQGLMDIVLDPDFVTNQQYYVFYTQGTPNRDRVSRFTASGATTSLATEFVVYQDDVNANNEHHGGALNFGRDGTLYITTGEHFAPDDAQSLTSYHGKILRLNKDGTVPTDNPFYDGTGPHKDAIWALGLRNPFRAFIDPVTDRFYIADVGGNDVAQSIEKLLLGTRGANYSWPICEYQACSDPQFTGPIYFYGHNGRDASITGGFIYNGAQFPVEYHGNYFFADYTQNWIKRLTFDANGNVVDVLNFEPPDGSADGPYGDIVYLTEGPDGALYYVDLGYADVTGQVGVGKVRRISYLGTPDQPPVAAAAAAPLAGGAPLTVTFSSSGSSDPEGQPLSYAWVFGDGATSSAANPVHTYTQTGLYTVRLTVSDGVNSTLADPLAVTVGTPPSVTISSPLDGLFFQAGDVINFSGDATDAGGGSLPASAFTWNIDFHHLTHVHPGLPITGSKTGSFQVPTTGHDFSTTTFYEIRLTVMGSNGLPASQSVFIYPTKVNLTFDTAPSGLAVTLDGIPRPTPFVYDDVIGFEHTVLAPDQTQGATTYHFTAWSDGGAQQHPLVVPPTDQTYVAAFDSTPSPLPAGLVAGYSLNEGSGTTVHDVTGVNHGTLNGAGWAQAKYGNGVTFSGTSGNVTIPNSSSLSFASSFTISAWVKPDALNNWQTILMKEVSGGCGYWLQTAGDQISSGFSTASGCKDHVTSTANLQTGVWYHVAAVFNDAANTYTIYVNGVAVLSQTETAVMVPNTQALVLGQSGCSSCGYERWKGVIDEVRLYNRALAPTEIQQDMSTPLN